MRRAPLTGFTQAPAIITPRSETSPATILGVDGDAEGLEVRMALLVALGYRVFAAGNGAAGLDLLGTEAIDVVLLDYQLPGMSSEDFVSTVRVRWPDLPIVLLSGTMRELPEGALRLADGFIEKGQPIGNLLSALEKLLERAGKKTKLPRI